MKVALERVYPDDDQMRVYEGEPPRCTARAPGAELGAEHKAIAALLAVCLFLRRRGRRSSATLLTDALSARGAVL